MILHLGVIDIPYAHDPGATKKRGRKARKGAAAGKPQRVAGGTQTTGDVAGWLETRYHIVEIFWHLHGAEIAVDLEDGLAGALETMLMGGPLPTSLFNTAFDKIAERFKTMIDSKELHGIGYPGVPTRASIVGIRSRFKNRLDPGRPSFQDSGLYETSFRAWTSE